MRYGWQRHRRTEKKALIDLSLTPLIDVALTLLVIFIITAPTLQTSIRIALPRGSSHAKNGTTQPSTITVFIDEKQHFFFNGDPVAYKDLIPAIKNNVAQENQKAVCVKADKTIAYGTVLELVNALTKIDGVSHVVFAMEQSPSPAPSDSKV